MVKGIVVSLYDYTGEALKPWAQEGYECHAYDIQHPVEGFERDGINYYHADLHSKATLDALLAKYNGLDVVFCMAFPVCTDLAVSGAAHFARKEKEKPGFQQEAASYAIWCGELFDALGVSYFIENPVSRLATLWRKPNYTFHPYEYGEYIPDTEAEHPRWPEYIAPKDAYTKKTCLWTGGNFTMPDHKPTTKPEGYSTQHLKLGGKSMKTKNIRSATPRGFAKAVFEANKRK